MTTVSSSVQMRDTWLFEMPSQPSARTRSSTRRVPGAGLRCDLGVHHRLGEHRNGLAQEVEVTPAACLRSSSTKFTLSMTTIVIPHVRQTFTRMARWSAASSLLYTTSVGTTPLYTTSVGTTPLRRATVASAGERRAWMAASSCCR